MKLLVDGELTMYGSAALVGFFILLLLIPIFAYIITTIREKIKRKSFIECQCRCIDIEYLGYDTEIVHTEGSLSRVSYINKYSYTFEYEVNHVKYQTQRRKKTNRSPKFDENRAVDFAPKVEGNVTPILVNKNDYKDTYIPEFDKGFRGKPKEVFEKAFVFVVIFCLLSMVGGIGFFVIGSVRLVC